MVDDTFLRAAMPSNVMHCMRSGVEKETITGAFGPASASHNFRIFRS